MIYREKREQYTCFTFASSTKSVTAKSKDWFWLTVIVLSQHCQKVDKKKCINVIEIVTSIEMRDDHQRQVSSSSSSSGFDTSTFRFNEEPLEQCYEIAEELGK